TSYPSGPLLLFYRSFSFYGDAGSFSGRFCRCVAISAGWKTTAAANVVSSDRPISLPMLDVPGWCENHRLPKAMAVVQALKRIARVRLDCRKFVPPARQAMM